ncbi:PREDICTED: uncharacterized protein LOC103324835 [Prunus mume]|uniref:Uncharacterized protein LOC103324835 n=1 Tax=Prunus mume TaxID=102107 RepID=A0ABM0NI75_PRUMU|nr:PREDICTED: uncharacterized protein LOC103324835 [Prunus mume]
MPASWVPAPFFPLLDLSWSELLVFLSSFSSLPFRFFFVPSYRAALFQTSLSQSQPSRHAALQPLFSQSSPSFCQPSSSYLFLSRRAAVTLTHAAAAVRADQHQFSHGFQQQQFPASILSLSDIMSSSTPSTTTLATFQC